MKKLVSVLAILLLAATVFAATGDKITLQASAVEKAPVFVIKGGTESGTYGTTGTQSGEIIVAPDTFDVGDKNTSITIYFQILQSGKAKYSGKTATVTITATELSFTDTDVTYSTGTGSATKIAIASALSMTGTAAETDGKITPGAVTTSGATQSVGLTYPAGTVNASTSTANTYDVLKTAYTWTGDDNLPVGTYTATITLTYTPN